MFPALAPGDARAYAFRHVEHRKDAGLSWQLIVASSKQPGDAMFVDNGGEWTRLDATGSSTFAGDVMPHAGFTHLAVQAMTDSSLVAVGEHFSQLTWIMEYEGIPATPH